MLKKILYFGTGTHLEPVMHFQETPEFILGDSLPRNAHGFDYYSKSHYGKYFLLQLENKINQMNLALVAKIILTNNFEEINVPNLESECLFLINNNNDKTISPQKIKYYTSISLPFDLYNNKELQIDIEACDTLLICGYQPHKKIIKYMQKSFNLIGYSNTYFPKNIDELDKEDENNIIHWIINNPCSIKSYIAVNRETGDKYFYRSYEDFYNGLENIRTSFISCPK